MKKYSIAIVYILLISFFCGACSKEKTTIEEESSSTTVNSYVSDTAALKNRISMAIVPSSNPTTFYENLKPLINYLEKSINKKIVVRFEINYENIVAGLENEYDIAMMGAYSYLEAHRLSGALPLVKSVRNGKPSYTALIITHESTGIQSLADLKKRKDINYLFTDKFSTSGFLFPAADLIKAGVDFSKGNYKFIKGHDNIVKNISLKTAEVGVCFAGAIERYLESSKAKEIKVIKITDEIPGDPIVISKKTAENAELTKLLSDAFIDLKDAAILAPLGGGLEGYAVANDNDYNILREKINIVNKYFK